MTDIGNQKRVSLPSGAELEITLAPFMEGQRLLSATAKCLKSVSVDGRSDVEDLTSNMNSLKDAFINCLTSQEMLDAILVCLKRCTYNKQRITSWDIFDSSISAREDYLMVCWEVCKFNLLPFMKNLFSKLSDLAVKEETSQK